MSAMFAAVRDTPYNIVLIVHILAGMVAFAPAFTHSLLVNQANGLPDESRRSLWGYMAGNGRKLYSPALIVVGLAGFALSGMSEGVHSLSQGWLIGSIILWIAMNGVLHAMLIPAERAVAAGDDAAAKRVDIGGPIMTVLLLITLYLMVFKPGA